jgi:hypothetical protein
MAHTYVGHTPKASYNVTITYTDKRSGQRQSKSFTDTYAARAFYVKKYKQGADPQIGSATVDNVK